MPAFVSRSVGSVGTSGLDGRADAFSIGEMTRRVTCAGGGGSV
jgi:hypothetical protein